MQAYHPTSSLNLPGGAPGLLITSPTQLINMNQQNSYQDLVKAYLPQLNMSNGTMANSLSTSSASSSPSSSSTSSTSSMASFAVRLMSLNQHELKCLNSDNELMRHIHEAQVLIENKLQNINSSTKQFEDVRQNKYQQVQNSQLNQLNLAIHQQQQHQHQQEQLHIQQQQHLLMSTDSYYQNLYAQQLALNQMAQLQHHQQQQQQHHHHHQQHLNQQQPHLLLMDSGYNKQTGLQIGTSNNVNLQLKNLSATLMTAPEDGISAERNGCNQKLQHPQVNSSVAPALDLRTTPTRPMSALSTTPSPLAIDSALIGNSNVVSAANYRQTNPVQHPKKAKLSEYRKMQQLAERNNSAGSVPDASNQKQSNNKQYRENSMKSTNLVNESNENDSSNQQNRLAPSSNKRTYSNDETASNSTTNTRASRQQNSQNAKPASAVSANGKIVLPTTTSKRYKGEFDEPSPDEVSKREQQLSRPGHYHCRALELGTCACIIGSEFTAKSQSEALEQLEKWRSLDIEERIKWKWDFEDLPKDIPLSDIKKFEDLRRDYSNGRADFGGASKRKPLGIRGTRQFLLMLYCLWGHPGRDDPMQQDGYCPHCFAKIRTENEQSTLVRVVNHFNMKHRRGANPRLSPQQLENNQQQQQQQQQQQLSSVKPTQHQVTTSPPPKLLPQSNQIRETLESVVEVVACEVGDVKKEKTAKISNH